MYHNTKKLVNLGNLAGLSICLEKLATCDRVYLSRDNETDGGFHVNICFAGGGFEICRERNMKPKRANAMRLRIQRRVNKAKAIMALVELQKKDEETLRDIRIRKAALAIVKAAHPAPAAVVNNFFVDANYQQTEVLNIDNSQTVIDNRKSSVMVTNQSTYVEENAFTQYICMSNVELAC